ncbi:MAG: hypothetical protein V3S31_06725 [Dehalococcoidia bacterium]
MPAQVGQLIASARTRMRPRWSQDFLAEELTLRGYSVTRGQIARLETASPGRHDAELLAAIAEIMAIPDALVRRAIMEDYEALQGDVSSKLKPPPELWPELRDLR